MFQRLNKCKDRKAKLRPKTSLFLKLVLSGALALASCSKPKAGVPVDDSSIRKVRDDLAQGSYEDCIKASKDIASQVPPGPFAPEALYLEGYAMAFGRTDFQGARTPLHQLLDSFPPGKFSADAQKLLADCHYWQGHYQTAGKEYKKLGTVFAGKGFDAYALFQTGNCLLLDDKVSDALSDYRELVEKYPTDSLADSAQLIIATSYLKLQNYKQAKEELQKLVSMAHDDDLQHAAQKALRQIEEEEPFRKGVGVPE